MTTQKLADVFSSEASADRFISELKSYHEQVRRQLEIRILVSGLVVGIAFGVLAFLLVQGHLDSIIPALFPGFKYVIAGAAYWLAIMFVGFGIGDDIYGWALKNNLTAGLDVRCSGFGESKGLELKQHTATILDSVDIVRIDVRFHEGLKKVCFECVSTGQVTAYVLITSLFVGGAVFGLSFAVA